MKLLIVVAPMVSRGGVYSWLHEATPVLRGAGWEVGVLWASRVEAEAPAADWSRRVGEGRGRLGRMRALPRAIEGAIEGFAPDRILSVLPQSDLACAQAVKGRARWTAMAHGQPFPAAGEGSLGRRVLWRQAVAWAYRRADAVVAVSDALGETLAAELGVADCHTVHNGVRLPPSDSLRPRRGRTVGFLGRLSPEKAPDLFLDCVREVDCRALLFGDGPLLGTVRAEAAEMPDVRVEGWADRDRALERVDLLLVPSRREAFGLSCVEAGARGIPVLARDVDGLGEILAPDPVLREHCLLPANAKPAAFRERLRLLLDDEQKRVQLGSRLRSQVERNFALPDQVLALANLL
jgi:glycosyltransferase involved in cell wall biosynthesis